MILHRKSVRIGNPCCAERFSGEHNLRPDQSARRIVIVGIGLSTFRGLALRSFLKTKRRPPLRLYNSQRWRNLRRHQRRIEPLCRFCKQRGINTPGTIVDHVIPWRGDANAFFTGELQTLCDACHFRIKQQAELLGYRLDAGLDGWPIDPKHPANRPRPSLRLVLANEIDTT